MNDSLEKTIDFLTTMGIRWEYKGEDRLIAFGDIDLSSKGLDILPELSLVELGGNFNCSTNQLTSLRGSPRVVHGDFSCDNNKIADLVGGPAIVSGNYFCHGNQLLSVDGKAFVIGGRFDCDRIGPRSEIDDKGERLGRGY